MSEAPEISVRMGIEVKLQRFNEALLDEDELGAVIRGHIYVENELIDFIRVRQTSPGARNGMRVNYADRIKLAISLGLDPSLRPALKFVGTLRNRFAHRLDAAIGKEDADAFESALGRHRAVMSDSFKTAHIKRGTFETAVPIARQEPRDRVTLAFVTLWAAMAVEAYQAAQSADQA